MIVLKNILVATDFGEASEAALNYGRELARTFGATLHVLHVVENLAATVYGAEGYVATLPDLQRDIEADERRRLDEVITDEDRRTLHATPTTVVSSQPAAAIVDYARSARVSLIVMGTHGRGALAHLVMGSVAERVVRLAPCPVLTVRHPEHEFVVPDALVAVVSA
jgi:nucleotide-binding universal stress UspA family protein